MARKDSGAPSGTRSSALWGTGNRGGESRSNALWGKGGRGRLLMTIALVALAAPIAAVAGSDSDYLKPVSTAKRTFIAPSLLEKAQSSPNELVRVIVQSAAGQKQPAAAFRKLDQVD